MELERFAITAKSIRGGCINRLADMDMDDEVEEYNWYAERYNTINGTLMAIQAEYHNNDE